MIEGRGGGKPPLGTVIPEMDHERVRRQIREGRVRAGAEAAREIARRIEDQGGFWGPREGAGELGAAVHRLPAHLSLVYVERDLEDAVPGSSTVTRDAVPAARKSNFRIRTAS